MLQTSTLAQTIPFETVKSALALDLPNDIVEALSPQIHAEDKGDQAAIVIDYHGTSAHVAEIERQELDEKPDDQTIGALYQNEATPYQDQPTEAKDEEEPVDTAQAHYPEKPTHNLFSRLPTIHLGHFRMTHRRRLFLNIAIILVLLLGASIFLTLKKEQDAKQQAIYQQIYPPSQQYYETGQGLESLNPTLSQDNYQKAAKLLQNGETKLKKGTTEYQQVDALLSKVQEAMQGGSSGTTASATPVSPADNSLLAIAQANSNAAAFGDGSTDIYMITTSEVISVSKSDGSKKTVIKNKGDWSSPKAVVPYEGNIYILDPKNGVLKYTPTGDGFGKSDYFQGNGPDLSQATSMAIDGSIWILLNNGTILQYTSGKSNGLKVTGLDTPMKQPTKIVTDIAMEHVYVLDPSTNRINSFDKHGAFQHAYTNPILAKAADFTVSEKDKTILVLSGGKVWKIAL